MSRFYEEELPDGYVEALKIDANDQKSSFAIKLSAVITAVVLFNAGFFLYALPRIEEIRNNFSIFKCFGFVFAYILYVVLHELTHGFVYKILTRRKLIFGFKPPAAYCGVPDIYVYRITSLFSLFAPFTVYGILFAVLFFIIPDPFSKAMILLLFSLHVTGCIGDFYAIGLFFFKFKNPITLRKDTGPTQTYYTKG